MYYLKDSIMNKIIGFCVAITFAALFHSCGNDEVEQDLNVILQQQLVLSQGR